MTNNKELIDLEKSPAAIFAVVTVASIFYAAGACFFMMPNDLAFGGTTGLSVLLTKIIPLSASTISTILNVLLIILALIMLGRRFALRTVWGSSLTTILIYVFGNFIPDGAIAAGIVWIDLLIAVLLIAIASAMLFSVDASSGGTDIPAMIIHDRKGIEIGKALFYTDILIAVSSGFLYGLMIGIYSVVGLALKAGFIDLFMKVIRLRFKTVQ